MTMRRLLVSSSGTGAIPGPSIRALAANGLWNDIPDPKAVTYNGKTYFAYVNDSGGVYVASYDHGTGTTSTPYAIATGYSSVSGNVHNSIALIVRNSDRRIVTVSCSEGMNHFDVRISTNPEDVTAFGSTSAILSGTGTFTYTSLAQLDNGDLYLWTTMEDGATAKLAYSKSTDGGVTWSAMTKVVSPTASTRTYRRIGTNGTRIDIFTTDTDRSVANPSSVYHLYMQGGLFYKSDGTQITASQPFAASQGTLVLDTTYGRARPTGWGYDSSGRPAVSINCRDLSADTPPEYVRVGRWNGSAWTTYAVADSSSQLIVSGAMVKANPNILFMARLVSGALEMHKYVSYDEGATWTGVQITSGSTDDHDAPDTPIGATRLEAIWGYGIYTGPGFAYDVKGWAR